MLNQLPTALRNQERKTFLIFFNKIKMKFPAKKDVELNFFVFGFQIFLESVCDHKHFRCKVNFR